MSQAILPAELNGHLTEVALGCQRMLEENPCHPEALVGISLVALASGQSEAAVKMAEAGRAGKARNSAGAGFFSMPNRAWATPSSSVAMRRSSRREAALSSCRCRSLSKD